MCPRKLAKSFSRVSCCKGVRLKVVLFIVELHVVLMVCFTVSAVSMELDVAAHGEKFQFNLHCLPRWLKTFSSSKQRFKQFASISFPDTKSQVLKMFFFFKKKLFFCGRKNS